MALVRHFISHATIVGVFQETYALRIFHFVLCAFALDFAFAVSYDMELSGV